MFKENSRYANLPVKTHVTPEGQEQTYVARRILPKPENLQIAGSQEVTSTDRLDLVAARAYGDATQFWRLADATTEFEPDRLTDTPGARLRVPMVVPE